MSEPLIITLEDVKKEIPPPLRPDLIIGEAKTVPDALKMAEYALAETGNPGVPPFEIVFRLISGESEQQGSIVVALRPGRQKIQV